MPDIWVIIENDVVSNRIVWDGDTDTYQPPAGATWMPDRPGVGIGWRYDSAQDAFTAPAVTVEPEPEVFAAISDRQFFQALAMPPYGIITTQEALDAVKTGEIPTVMQTVIDTLPADDQFAATMLIAGATLYERHNALVEVFGASQGMNAAAIDAFWRFAEGL